MSLPVFPKHLYFRIVTGLAVCICVGCAAATETKPSAAAVFTQAAQTAAAQQTANAAKIQTAIAAATATAAMGNPNPQSTPTVAAQNTVEAAAPTATVAAPATADGAQASNTPAAIPSATQSAAQQNTPPASGSEAACIPANAPKTGKVLNIVDGDTIKVMIDGKTFTVRYIGIDAPEYVKSKEYYSTEAWLKNSDLVYAKDITLYADGTDTDPAGRLLRYVKVGDIFVNWALVSQGFAKAAADGTNTACDAVFQSGQDQASAAKAGIWGKP